jgi:hypothetical protein
MIASTDAHLTRGGAVEAFLCVAKGHSMPLNQSQALSLATTLSILEERCDQIEHLLTAAPTRGVLHHTVRDIPVDTHPALSAYLTQLRAEIARLAAAYQLDAAPHSATRILVALLATSWQDLEDVRSAKLIRYGALDPAVVPPLDTGVAELITLIQGMQSLLSEHTTNGRMLDVTH